MKVQNYSWSAGGDTHVQLLAQQKQMYFLCVIQQIVITLMVQENNGCSECKHSNQLSEQQLFVLLFITAGSWLYVSFFGNEIKAQQSRLLD